MESTRAELIKYDDFKLRHEWKFYEVYEALVYKKTKAQDYLANIHTVYTFDNLTDFAHFWNTTNYRKITPIFTDPFNNIIRKIKDKELKIGSIALFKSNIMPTWEDKENSKGGEYGFKITGDNGAELSKLWEKLVFTLIGELSELVDDVLV